jgi:hypothetical protein
MLEYLLLPFAIVIDGKPDVTHAPTFKPTADSVIGDRVFFTGIPQEAKPECDPSFFRRN